MKSPILLRLFLALLATGDILAPRFLPAATLSFREGTNGYTGTLDTELRSAQPAVAQGTNSTVQADSSDGQPAGPVQGLIKFTGIIGSGTNQIPPQSLVNSATLTLRSTAADSASTNSVTVSRMIVTWDESSTWNSLTAGISADNIEARGIPDTAFAPSVAVPFSAPLANAAMTATVQAWVNGTAPNEGFLFLAVGPDNYRFDSSESTIITNRPLLTVVFTPPGPPTINAQPVSQTLCTGNNAVFTVNASGAPPLVLRWRFNGNVIPNATNSSFTVTNAQSVNVGAYSVVVSNSFDSVTSSNANLTLLTPVTATGPTNSNGCSGDTIVLGTTASGTGPITYQWFRGTSPLQGQTNSTLTFQFLNVEDAGTYCVRVTGACNSVTNCANVGVGDFTAPQMFCSNTVVNTDLGGCSKSNITYAVTVIDDCAPNPRVICQPSVGSTFVRGVFTVRCTADDFTGHTNSCTFTVTVRDGQPPTITCPQTQFATATGTNSPPIFYPPPTAFDNCDLSTNLTLTCTPPPGSTFPIGTSSVTCRATDATGNSNTCQFQVVIAPAPCCDGNEWSLFSLSGPTARVGHSVAYDSVRQRIVLFGGLVAGSLNSETWEWDGFSWSLRASTGPSPRAFTAMAYDSARNRTVLFGGLAGGGHLLSDTWEWNGTVWQSINVTGPSLRQGHAMAFDNTRNRTVLFGGLTGANPPFSEVADTWEYNGTSWVVAAGAVGPDARSWHGMAYHTNSRQMVLFGGLKGSTLYGDTWGWNGSAWSLLATSGPSPRAYLAMAANADCNRLVLFGGGSDTNRPFGDTWEWLGATWKLAATSGPPARVWPAMAYDSFRKRSTFFGGATATGTNSFFPQRETWVWQMDQTSPFIAAVSTICGENVITVTFSEPIVPQNMVDPANYTVFCGNSNVTVIGTQFVDAKTVDVIISAPVPAGFSCVIGMNNTVDLCGNQNQFAPFQFSCQPPRCNRGNGGKDFWLTFPGNYAPDSPARPAPQLFIGGSPGTVGTVSVPGLVPPFSVGYAIPPAGVSIVTLTLEAELALSNDLVENKGIHVVASKAVTVYGYNHVANSSDAYLGLPTNAVGRAYLFMSYQNVFANVPELNGNQLAVVANFDNTTVTIVPSVTVGAHPANIPFSKTLSRGQTYQLRETNGAPADLTGSIIVADQPISVFGSHQCANIPNTNVFFCNHLVEQLWPVEMFANQFVTVPLTNRTKGDTIRCLALQNNTTVTIRTNGVNVVALLSQGQFREVLLKDASQINADHPILVTQFANSSDFDRVRHSDPFMVLVPPTTLFDTIYVVQTPTNDFGSNFVNIMASAAAVGQVRVDGTKIAAGAYSAIGASGFSSARVEVPVGSHIIDTTNGANFGLIVYGWAEYDAYGYPGGFCGAELPTGPTPGCPPSQLVVTATNCIALMPDLATLVTNREFAVAILQNPAPGTPLLSGRYDVTTTTVDQLGNRRTCVTALTVILSPSSGLACPGSVSTNCASSSQGQIVNYQVTICSSNYTLMCLPSSGSFFPTGTSTVNCEASSSGRITDRCSFPVNVICQRVSISTPSGGKFVLTWFGGGTLQRAPTVTGPWNNVPNATSPFQVTTQPGVPQEFYRVQF